MALRPDINLIRGDSSSINFEFTVDGVPSDLTGTTVFFTAKPTTADDGDDTAVIKVEVTVHSDPTNGKTIIPLSATDTNIAPATYYYDIQVKKGDVVTSIQPRLLKILADITRRTT